MLPTSPAAPEETQVSTILSKASQQREITCWPEAIQYVLRAYETASARNEGLKDLRNVKQDVWEKYKQPRKHSNGAICRCGNVRREDEKITIYIDCLSPTINMVFTNHREKFHRSDLILTSLCHIAKLLDDAYFIRLQYITAKGNNVNQVMSLNKAKIGYSRTILFV